MTLDHDNLYSTKDVFYKLYNEAEKYNLDLLGFAGIITGVEINNIKKENFLNFNETNVINKTFIQERFFGLRKENKSSTSLCLYFIRKNPLVNVIKK